MSIDDLKNEGRTPSYFEQFLSKNGDGIKDLIEFLGDSYSGAGGYIDGGYLIPHVREEVNRYKRRVWQSYYLNFFKLAVDAFVNPLYRTPINRHYESENSSGVKQWLVFEDNANLRGDTFTKFMKKASRYAKTFGKVFILVDNKKTTSPSLGQALLKRDVPYAVILKPDRITDWKVNAFGQIESITYTELSDGVSRDGETVLNRKTWTREEWILSNEDGDILARDVNPLGYVPVIEYKTIDSEDFIPHSGLIQTAKANFRLYNLTSEIQEIESNQMYPILVVPDSIPSSATIGTGNGFRIGDGNSTPSYISPSPDPVRVLREGAKELIGNIFSMSGLSFIAGINNLSAESKKWDFERTESILKDFSQEAQTVEEQISIIFGDWVGESVGMSSSYPQEFGISDLGEELARASDMIANLALGNVGNAEVSKSYIEKEFFHSSQDFLDTIFESIDDEAKARGEGSSTIDEDFAKRDDEEPIEDA